MKTIADLGVSINQFCKKESVFRMRKGLTPLHWYKKKFAGLFDSRLLCCEGTVVPTAVKIPKPNVLKSALEFDNRNSRRRTRKIPDDRNWYRIVKNECFDCPNCHEGYDINRSDLKRNRVVSDILQKMLENEPGKNDNISTDQQGISS